MVAPDRPTSATTDRIVRPNVLQSATVRTLAILTIFMLAGTSAAQEVPAIRQLQPLTYEVASVKPDRTGGPTPRTILASAPGQLHLANASVMQLVQFVYAVLGDRIVNAPEWSQIEKWDVHLTAPGSSYPDLPRQVLQLLHDRFKLQAHVETSERPIYLLSQARPGRLASGVQTSDADCHTSQVGGPQNFSLKCTD